MGMYRVTKATTQLEIFDVEAESELDAVAKVAALPGKLVTQNAAWSAVLTDGFTPEPVDCPTGFGVYLRRITGGSSDATIVAERCRKAGILWAHFMVESSDGYVTSPATRSVWARAFKSAGISVGVWSFPGDARSASVQESVSAANLLADAAAEIDAQSVMVNIEKPYKGKPAETEALCDAVYARSSGMSWLCGVISYPIPSYHPDLNWSAMSGFEFASPMFYQTAQDPVAVNRGLGEWYKIVKQVVPSLDGWSGTGVDGAARFREDIVRVCGAPPDPREPGAIVWSESQMDDVKRAVTRDMAEKYGWPLP